MSALIDPVVRVKQLQALGLRVVLMSRRLSVKLRPVFVIRVREHEDLQDPVCADVVQFLLLHWLPPVPSFGSYRYCRLNRMTRSNGYNMELIPPNIYSL